MSEHIPCPMCMGQWVLYRSGAGSRVSGCPFCEGVGTVEVWTQVELNATGGTGGVR